MTKVVWVYVCVFVAKEATVFNINIALAQFQVHQ